MAKNKHSLNIGDSSKGGRRRAELYREGRRVLKAVERGELVPSSSAKESSSLCPHLESSIKAVAKAAGLEYKPPVFKAVPCAVEVDPLLLELQHLNTTQRARLLAD